MSSDNEDSSSWCNEPPRRIPEAATPVAFDPNFRVCVGDIITFKPCNTPWDIKDVIRKIEIIKDDDGGDDELNIFAVNGYMVHTTVMLNDKWYNILSPNVINGAICGTLDPDIVHAMKERKNLLRVKKREADTEEAWRKSGITNSSDEETESEEETEKEKSAKLRSAEIVREARAVSDDCLTQTNRHWYRDSVAIRKAQEARDAVHLLHLLHQKAPQSPKAGEACPEDQDEKKPAAVQNIPVPTIPKKCDQYHPATGLWPIATAIQKVLPSMCLFPLCLFPFLYRKHKTKL
jgi:hypothetical protein